MSGIPPPLAGARKILGLVRRVPTRVAALEREADAVRRRHPPPTRNPGSYPGDVKAEGLADVQKGAGPALVVRREPAFDLVRKPPRARRAGAGASLQVKQRLLEHGQHQPLLGRGRGGGPEELLGQDRLRYDPGALGRSERGV